MYSSPSFLHDNLSSQPLERVGKLRAQTTFLGLRFSKPQRGLVARVFETPRLARKIRLHLRAEGVVPM